MKVTKRPSLSCSRCKGMEATAQFRNLSEGNADAKIMLISSYPTHEECVKGRFFVSEAGIKFRYMFRQHVIPLEDCLITSMIKCAAEPRLHNIRNCYSWLEPTFKQERKVIVCLGRFVLKYLFMRGAAPPPLDVLLGRVTRMPEHKAAIVTLPEPEELLLVTQDPNDFRYNPARELQDRQKQMRRGLVAVADALEEL